MNEQKLTELFYDPEFGLQSAAKFVKKAKSLNLGTTKQIQDFINKQEITQISKKVRKTKTFSKIVAPPYSFMIDIMHLPIFAKANKNYSGILLCLEICSRKVFAYPMKGRTMKEILEKYAQFVKDAGRVYQIESDDEFNAKAFHDFNEKLKIKVETDVAKDIHITHGDKLALIDRYTRTLRYMIAKYMTQNETREYISVLPKLISNYNNTPHESLQDQTPNEVYNNLPQMYKNFFEGNLKNQVDKKETIKIGDMVRLITYKELFAKEEPRFSREVYKVEGKDRNKYIITNAKDGVEYIRAVKPNELLVVKEIAQHKPQAVPVIKQAKREARVERRLKSESIDQSLMVRNLRSRKTVDPGFFVKY